MSIRQRTCFVRRAERCVSPCDIDMLFALMCVVLSYQGSERSEITNDMMKSFPQATRPEGVRRNALRVQRPKSPHFEESAQA